MEIRIRATGAVMFEDEFRRMYHNTSFPLVLTDGILDTLGADPVFNGPQPTPSRYQTVYRDGVEQIQGKWYTKYGVADMEADAKAALDARQAAQVRSERTRKLSECDWTQLADAPVNTQAWATYRQALRDITAQAGFPWDVQWPEKP